MNPSRRQLLVGAAGAASAALLAACGSDDTASSDSTDSTADADGELRDGFALQARFPNHPLFTPGEVRLPFSVLQTDGSGSLNPVDSGPAELTGWIETLDGTRITDVVAVRRNDGLTSPYWSVRATLEAAVVYTMRIEGDDGYGALFEVFDPADVKTPNLGAALPPFDTPTVDDHRGVEPYCSLTPDPCPFHDITLTEALQQARPLAYIIGTPAHCSTGTCTPGLQFLMEESERLGDALVVVHADVYADAEATVVAPAIEALDVMYEPIIYFCDASGVVVDRLDGVWDRSELRERVDAWLTT